MQQCLEKLLIAISISGLSQPMLHYQQFINQLKAHLQQTVPKKEQKAYQQRVFDAMLPSFSGFGEDAHLLHIIHRRRGLHPGFYVDLGAFDPISHSNTFLLHLLGWKGLNVDANPRCIEEFKSKRPKDINIHAGVSDREETLPFFNVGIGLGSSFNEEWVKNIAAKHNRTIHNAQETYCYPVNTLLEEYLPEGTHIDVLDIDLEGNDARVIKALDWQKYRPSFVLIEHHADSIQEVLETEFYTNLSDQGYKIIAYLAPTVIFSASTVQP